MLKKDGRLGANGSLPNFLVIGAAKSGTSSLHACLARHPQIYMSSKKELRYFVPREQLGRYDLGPNWYRSNFPTTLRVRGESSPQYSVFPKVSGIPERIKATLGSAKLIYILRDPVERILSDFLQIVDEYYPAPDFPDFLSTLRDRESYFYSLYFLQLSQYLQVFPRQNILVLISERFSSNPRLILRTIFEFLSVDEAFSTAEFDRRYNVRHSSRYVAPWFNSYAPEFLKAQLRDPVLRSKIWRLYRLVHWASRVGGRTIIKPQLTVSDDFYLQALLREDVSKLRTFLADPIPEWRPYH